MMNIENKQKFLPSNQRKAKSTWIHCRIGFDCISDHSMIELEGLLSINSRNHFLNHNKYFASKISNTKLVFTFVLEIEKHVYFQFSIKYAQRHKNDITWHRNGID